MSEHSQLDALVALITAQRGQYDRATIREQLVRDGADPGLVDQALARVFDEPHRAAVYDVPAAPIPARVIVPEPATVEQIRRYLETHRGTYDREALRQQLIKDGQPREAIDLAFAQVFGLSVTAAPALAQQPSSNGRIFLIFLGVTALNLVLSGGLAYAATLTEQVLVALLPGILLLGAEIAAMVRYRERNRALSRGIMWALIAALPVIAFGLLLGWCVAIIQTL